MTYALAKFKLFTYIVLFFPFELCEVPRVIIIKIPRNIKDVIAIIESDERWTCREGSRSLIKRNPKKNPKKQDGAMAAFRASKEVQSCALFLQEE
ncbi:MAG: hypothetical protein Q4F13_08360 [Pseudomonadota bacterium]|nr:hypothetical protein [Pseudomonadota bacterium]